MVEFNVYYSLGGMKLSGKKGLGWYVGYVFWLMFGVLEIDLRFGENIWMGGFNGFNYLDSDMWNLGFEFIEILDIVYEEFVCWRWMGYVWVWVWRLWGILIGLFRLGWVIRCRI